MARTLEDFSDISDTMIWKEPAQKQLRQFSALGEAFRVIPKVIGTHTSKSIALPVVRYELHHGKILFTLRDNFYNVNCWVGSLKPINIPYDVIAEERTFEWYQNEIKRKREYCYAGWQSSEMNDPQILRVKVKDHWNEVRGDEKDRWIARDHSTDWWSKDWSGGKLVAVGDSEPFSSNTTFYILGPCFAEGMDKLWGTKPGYYEPGSRNFIFETSWKDIRNIIASIRDSI